MSNFCESFPEKRDGKVVHTVTDAAIADLTAVEKERDLLIAALEDIREWCINAKKTCGVEPYGLAVAEKALAQVQK